MKFFLIALFLFILGAVFIISNNNLAIADGKNAQIFCEKYSLWFGSILNNLKEITGYAVRLDWAPENI